MENSNYKEQDKFYYPNINEFYIGFEFYKMYIDKENNVTWKVENNFQKVFMNNGTDTVYELEMGISNQNILVKYLDNEDIESLGWKKQEFSFLENHWCFKIGKSYSDDELFLYRGISHKNREHTKITNRFEDKVYFDGYIKNKSELNKLLQQINYLPCKEKEVN